MIPKSMLDEINRWIDGKKFGNLQINFSGGKIVNFNRFESVKLTVTFNNPTSAVLEVTHPDSNLDS